MGYSPWGRKESDTTEQLSTNTHNSSTLATSTLLSLLPIFFIINIYLLKKAWPHPVLAGGMQALLLGW